MSRNGQAGKILNNQKGFTLIEMIIVIVILGILAVMAVPKYIDMRVEARRAAVGGLAGGIAGAAAIAHAACIVDTACNPTLGTDTTTLSGTTVNMVFGYPDATAAGIIAAMDYTAGQFTATANATPDPDTYTLHLTTAAGGGCEVVYTAAADANTAASTTTTTTTCTF